MSNQDAVGPHADIEDFGKIRAAFNRGLNEHVRRLGGLVNERETMTNDHKPAPHAANDSAHAKPKTTRPPAPKAAPKAAPKPAPRPPIQSVVFKGEAAPSKGKIALAVATTVGAIGGIAYGIAGVAGRMLRRGR